MNFLRQGFRKLLSDRQPDRHDRNYIPRRFAGGQKCECILPIMTRKENGTKT